ncbi:MAG: alpha/beta hydrolase [Cyclobacteriaceae bacterium]
MKFFKHPIYPLLISLLIISSCADDDVSEIQERGDLVSSELVFARGATQVQTLLTIAGLDLPFEEFNYNVSFYKAEYLTIYKGENITVSSLVVLPDNFEGNLSTVSFQHGTIASNSEAPSQLKSDDNLLSVYASLASIGTMVVVPDFIGFGSSVDIMHPYYAVDLTATSIFDNIYAARTLAEEKGFALSPKLYLAGYSQGGHATMSAHKYYEENEVDFFELQASFPAAGGYDVVAFKDYFLSLETFHQPFFLAYVAQSYNESFDLNEPLDKYFNEPYASRIPDLFDGSLSGGQVNQQLTDVISDYLTEGFIINNDDETFDTFNQALENNSLVNWIPQIPIHMYHGDADITVPYQNSIISYDRLIENGASPNIVKFTTLPGGEHVSGFVPYLELFLDELIEYENK